jgi:hypothetical protein
MMRIDFVCPKSIPMIEVPINKSVFGFNAMLNLNDQILTDPKEISVCVNNSNDLLFESSSEIYDMMISKLCKDPKYCSTVKDLNKFDDEDIAFEINAKSSNVSLVHNQLKKGIFLITHFDLVLFMKF